MLLESVVLEKIATTNLLSFSLSQTQLQNNFTLILAALKHHDSLLAQHHQNIKNIESLIKNNQQNQQKKDYNSNQVVTGLKRDIEEAKKNIVASDLRINRIEDNLETVLRINPQNDKKESQISNLEAVIKQFEQKIGKVEGKVSKVELKAAEIDSLSLKVKEQEARISTLESIVKDQQATIKRIEQEISKIQSELSSIRQRRPSTAKLNSLAETEADIKKIYGQIRSIKEDNQKMSIGLEARLGELSTNGPSPKQKENIQDVSKKMKKISDDVWKLNQQVYISQKQYREKDAFSQAQIDQLMKKIHQLAEKLELFKGQNSFGARTIVSARQPLTTEWSPQPSAFPDLQKKTIEQSPPKDIEKEADSISFRKQIIDKLKQQRSDFNKAIKRLDFAATKKQEDLSKLSELQERVLKLEHLMEGKLDEDGLKKWMKYIENKIGYLYRIVNVQASQEDACIARKNWICLSCDKKLEAYRGKVGSHLISAQFKGKGIDQQVVGGGMLFRNKSKYELPQFKK